jgi:type II secretory pathway pseudopilin PulG
MKISRKVWIIVGIGIIVVLLGILFTVYFRQVREREELNDSLSAARTLLPTIITQKEDLGNQLSQAQSLLDTSQAQFPQAVESIEYGEYIFEIAERCSLTLASLTFPKPTNRTEGSVTYSVVSLSLPVSGALADIFEFIDIIRTDPRFASTQVKSVNLDVGGGSATISVDIYGYRR